MEKWSTPTLVAFAPIVSPANYLLRWHKLYFKTKLIDKTTNDYKHDDIVVHKS